jgi:hypothetical protein
VPVVDGHLPELTRGIGEVGAGQHLGPQQLQARGRDDEQQQLRLRLR